MALHFTDTIHDRGGLQTSQSHHFGLKSTLSYPPEPSPRDGTFGIDSHTCPRSDKVSDNYKIVLMSVTYQDSEGWGIVTDLIYLVDF